MIVKQQGLRPISLGMGSEDVKIYKIKLSGNGWDGSLSMRNSRTEN